MIRFTFNNIVSHQAVVEAMCLASKRSSFSTLAALKKREDIISQVAFVKKQLVELNKASINPNTLQKVELKDNVNNDPVRSAVFGIFDL